jgi:ABC-2 type transport system ATP-binding protein
MKKLGKKQLMLHLQQPIASVPESLAGYHLEVSATGDELTFTYDTKAERTGITSLLKDLTDAGIRFNDLQTRQSSLEDIFVHLVSSPA